MNRRTETRPKRAPLWLSAVVVALLWQIGAGSPLVHAETNSLLPPPPHLANRLTVAVLGFENKTGDPANAYWGNAILKLIGGSLQEISALRELPDVEYALHEVNRKDGDPLTVEEAARAGQAIEARRVLWGDYNRQGEKWLVTVRILTSGTGKISPTFSATSANWFEIRDALVKKIIGELAVRPSAKERKKMLRRTTSSPLTFENLAKASALHQDKGSMADQEKYARSAVEADPHCAEAQFDVGVVLFNQGKYEDAATWLRRSLELRPDYADALLALGECLAFQGKYEQAEVKMLEAVRLDPDSNEGWEELGAMSAAQDAAQLAAECFRRSLQLDPFSAGPHARLGAIYAAQGRRDAALAELKRAEQLAFAEDVNDEQDLARSFDALHDIPSAIAHYEKLITASRKLGVDAGYIERQDARLKELKKSLAPEYLTVQFPKEYAPTALTNAFREKLTPAELSLVVNPIASTPEMDHWAQAITAGATNELGKAHDLFDALARHVDDGPLRWRTAQGTFDAWNKPGMFFRCQEYAFLYVALARAVGLKSYDVLVEKDCEGRRVEHACAAVFIGDKALLVDPMYRWFGVQHQGFKVLDDLQTTALYMACQSGDWRLARIAEKLSADSVIQSYAIGTLIEAERWDHAREAMSQVSWADQDLWRRDLLQAYFVAHDGHNDEALAFLQKTIKENPDSANAYSRIGNIYYDRKQLKDALPFYREALDRVSDKEERDRVRATITLINEKIGDKASGSQTELGSAAEYIYRGDGRNHDGDTNGAINDYTKAIELDPRLTDAFLHRAYTYGNQSQREKALRDFDQVIVLDPGNAEAHEYRGLLYLEKKNYEKAFKDLSAAIALKPADPDFYDELARLLLDCTDPHIHDSKAALDNAKKACDLSGWAKSPFVARLAFAYAANNDFQNAIDLAQKTSYLADTTADLKKNLQEWIDYWEASNPGLKPLKPLPQMTLPSDLWTSTNDPVVRATPPAAVNVSELKKSAESGNTRAQTQLANELYQSKSVTSADRVQAYKWATVAASSGDKDASACLREFEIFMSADEISAGKAAATVFLKEFAKKK